MGLCRRAGGLRGAGLASLPILACPRGSVSDLYSINEYQTASGSVPVPTPASGSCCVPLHSGSDAREQELYQGPQGEGRVPRSPPTPKLKSKASVLARDEGIQAEAPHSHLKRGNTHARGSPGARACLTQLPAKPCRGRRETTPHPGKTTQLRCPPTPCPRQRAHPQSQLRGRRAPMPVSAARLERRW